MSHGSLLETELDAPPQRRTPDKSPVLARQESLSDISVRIPSSCSVKLTFLLFGLIFKKILLHLESIF